MIRSYTLTPTASTSSGFAETSGSESEWRTDAIMSRTRRACSGEICRDSETTAELIRWCWLLVEGNCSNLSRREVRVCEPSVKMSFGKGMRPCSKGSRRGCMYTDGCDGVEGCPGGAVVSAMVVEESGGIGSWWWICKRIRRVCEWRGARKDHKGWYVANSKLVGGQNGRLFDGYWLTMDHWK